MKRVGPALYNHVSALSDFPVGAQLSIAEACGQVPEGWQLVRVDRRHGLTSSIMFGWTTSWEEPHPKLLSSILVKRLLYGQGWLAGVRRNYRDTPIYHRKETMLPANHPRREEFARLTAQEEAAGLLGRKDLGRQSAWDRELERRGLHIENHQLE